MGHDAPPQTVGEALEFGWTAMVFECSRRRCRHKGQFDLIEFRGSASLAQVFRLAVCCQCGGRPTYARLVLQLESGSWHYKRIEIDGDRIRRAARE